MGWHGIEEDTQLPAGYSREFAAFVAEVETRSGTVKHQMLDMRG